MRGVDNWEYCSVHTATYRDGTGITREVLTITLPSGVWISLGSRAPSNLLPVAVGEVSPEPGEAFAPMNGA